MSTYLCYECGVYRPVDVMQKYECSVCGGRKCLLHHTVDKNITCGRCGLDKLCNDCCAFGECCEFYQGG